jgi:hypothetical protein
MFNVTNQFTFGAIFQRPMGANGDVARRRGMVVDIVVSWLTNVGVGQAAVALSIEEES